MSTGQASNDALLPTVAGIELWRSDSHAETVEAVAIREVKEETGLEVKISSLLGIYSEPERDPRGHVVSIVYLAREVGGMLRADSDAKEVGAFNRIPDKLAFDHRKILRDALDM